METRFGFIGRAAGYGLVALFLLIGGKARAQNYPVLTAVPGHVYVVRGASIRSGDYVSVEPAGLFFFGPIRRPVAAVARPMLGVGGSGVGIGLAASLVPPEWMRNESDADFCIGPFVSIEGHVERMYWPTSWRSATYAGPNVSLSFFAVKASLGWMVDVTDRTNGHIQVAFGAGF